MNNEEDFKTKDYTEEYEKNDEEIEEEAEEYGKNDEEIEEEAEEKQKDKKPKKNIKIIILIIITSILVVACIICFVLMKINNKKNNNQNTIEEAKIVRPSENEKYIPLKQNYFNISCKHTKTGEKYKTLSKGLIIDCVFGYGVNSNQKVSELYFDLNNSANVKLKEYKNDSDAKLINDKNTYKLTANTPDSVLVNGIHFYYEVLNDTDDVGYVEVANIVFKDDNNKYYKVVNSIESFPPEYDDKLYIYKDTYEDEDLKVYYYSSKTKYTDQELVDTFQCKSEACESVAEANSYFLINDEGLLIYDTIKKTSNTLKISNDVKLEDYTYELMLNPKGKIYGVMFKKNYQSDLDCEMNEYVCINTGLSGYEIGYYSMELNNFSIALDYGFIGSSAFNGYDVALMLKKDDSFGIFSYENDNMMIELSNKYKSIDYDDDIDAIMLEVYDKTNKNYYFEYYDPRYAQFVVDTDNLDKFESSSIYYTTAYNNEGKRVTMLFDSKGNQLKKLPYVLSDKLVSVSDKIVVKNEVYEVYDLKGNKLYQSEYDPANVLAYTESYTVINKDNYIALLDSKGKDLVNVKQLVSGVKFISAEEKEKGVLILIIKDAAITEEGKNAYKYIIEYNKPFQTETIFVE